MTEIKNSSTSRRLIRGSTAIARYLGDPSMCQVLRASPEEFHLFKVGGMLAGYSDILDAIMAEKFAAGAPPAPCYARAEAKRKGEAS